MLTKYGQREWLAVLAGSAFIIAALGYLHWWWPIGLVVLAALALLSFFRDPPRKIPRDPGILVSPADGVVSSVHRLEHYEPLGGPAHCVRIFLSVLNVHLNRSPCDALVESVTPRPGRFLNALNPTSAEVNESNLIVLRDPATGRPVAAVRQVAGLIARTIVCRLRPGQALRRGERFGMIKFGSTTELYFPESSGLSIRVARGQRVYGGRTILAGPSPTGK